MSGTEGDNMELNNKIDKNEKLHTQLSVMEMEYQRKMKDVNGQMESLRAESEANEKAINESLESQKMIERRLSQN